MDASGSPQSTAAPAPAIATERRSMTTLPIGQWGSAGYQVASEPLGGDSDRRFRQGFSAWIDPARIWADTQRR